jgi:radical SAM superfamily enzyme YgiQ (UPF0313 family)
MLLHPEYFPDADYIITGEGEKSLLKLIEQLEK